MVNTHQGKLLTREHQNNTNKFTRRGKKSLSVSQVRLNNTDRFYSAYIQDVSPDDGPVTVFIEELGEKYVCVCVCE